MSAIDAVDIVSILLGIAIAVAFVSANTRRWSLDSASPLHRALIVVGASLILGYVISEVVHALQAARG